MKFENNQNKWLDSVSKKRINIKLVIFIKNKIYYKI